MFSPADPRAPIMTRCLPSPLLTLALCRGCSSPHTRHSHPFNLSAGFSPPGRPLPAPGLGRSSSPSLGPHSPMLTCSAQAHTERASQPRHTSSLEQGPVSLCPLRPKHRASLGAPEVSLPWSWPKPALQVMLSNPNPHSKGPRSPAPSAAPHSLSSNSLLTSQLASGFEELLKTPS